MQVRFAAVATFLNVLFLTLLFTIGAAIRRRFTVDRPVREIQKVLDRLTNGDYSARISESFIAGKYSKFGEIAESINDLAKELSGVETLRTDFISNVSHELKTPLAVMQNYGTMLQQPELSEEKRMEYAKSISDASRRLAHLITNILKLNKLENQQIFPDMKEYDLSEQIVECLLQFENVWEKKNIDIDTDIPAGVSICADAELLTLVWNNLLSNAFKFTEDGGTVGVQLIADEQYVIVKVSDSGCGMKPEVGARIFDKFYQGDTSHSTQGNGLGLALVKRVVDIMQGEIGVESVYGQGSIFTVKVRRF
ncbi:MAG: ATP-binding protein [Lachnospiraceae bacterium]